MIYKMRNINKAIFINTLFCPTLGWLVRNQQNERFKATVAEQFRMDEGKYVHKKARHLYPNGIYIDAQKIVDAVSITKKYMEDQDVLCIYEATFNSNNYVAKPDIMLRDNDSWHIFEIKSALKEKPEYIEDMAYTIMVMKKSGVKVSKVSLLLISRDFRLGMPYEKLFNEINQTEAVLDRVLKFDEYCEEADRITSSTQCPEAVLKYECRSCHEWKNCLGKDVQNYIFDIPRIGKKKFDDLVKKGITHIEKIKDDSMLSAIQQKVKECVHKNEIIVNNELLNDLRVIEWPAYYLDFESVKTAVPLYPDIAPHHQIPTQYSIHKCSDIDNVQSHFEYIADPQRDSRRELAEKLIEHLENIGSIIVYSGYEKRMLNDLGKIFPDLAEQMNSFIKRLIDLEAILKKNVNHPEFHGKTSLKITLPTLVSDLTYDDLDIADGDSAVATFAYMALGKYDDAEKARKKQALLDYCKQDTLALVKLHASLMELA